MKPVTITIDEDLDERAATEARRLGVSKSELIRRGLEAVLPEGGQRSLSPADAWTDLAGFGSPGIRVAPEEIDDVVYGP